jgi:hypothetical protein
MCLPAALATIPKTTVELSIAFWLLSQYLEFETLEMEVVCD